MKRPPLNRVKLHSKWICKLIATLAGHSTSQKIIKGRIHIDDTLTERNWTVFLSISGPIAVAPRPDFVSSIERWIATVVADIVQKNFTSRYQRNSLESKRRRRMDGRRIPVSSRADKVFHSTSRSDSQRSSFHRSLTHTHAAFHHLQRHTITFYLSIHPFIHFHFVSFFICFGIILFIIVNLFIAIIAITIAIIIIIIIDITIFAIVILIMISCWMVGDLPAGSTCEAVATHLDSFSDAS